MVRTRRSDYGEGEASDGASTSGSRSTKEGRVEKQYASRSLVGKGWNLVKQIFFTIVHIYKSLTAFWSQMHVCMLPALGELDNEEVPPQEDEVDQEVAPPSPKQRKRAAAKAD